MWWLVVPAAMGLGKLVYDAVTNEDDKSKAGSGTAAKDNSHAILRRNIDRLHLVAKNPHPHRIAIMGQPGAGKSSLLKKLSQGRADPVPVVGVHTDATNWAERPDVTLLCNWDEYVASDVPGYDTASHPVSMFIEHFPFRYYSCVLLVVRGKVRDADSRLYRQAKGCGAPVVLVRSCAEGLDADERCAVADDFCTHFPGIERDAIVFASCRSGEGIERLRALI